MHVCTETAVGRWVVDWSRECPDYADARAVIETHKPVIQFSLREMRPLMEMTFTDIAQRIDPGFLLQGQRAKYPPTGLPREVYGWRGLRGTYYKGFDNDTMMFDVTSSEIEITGKIYQSLIKFLNWDEVAGDPEMKPRAKATYLMWNGDIQLHCDDPSFLYYGYQYILTQLDASIYQELRYPHIRNPQLRGIVCKHLNRVLRALPFFIGDMAKAITEQFGGQVTKEDNQAIRQRTDLQRQADQIPADQVIPEPEPAPFDLNQYKQQQDRNPQQTGQPAPQQPGQQTSWPTAGQRPAQERPKNETL